MRDRAYWEARAKEAEARAERAEVEAAQWKGSFDGMVGVEKELRARAERAEGAALRVQRAMLEGSADEIEDALRDLFALTDKGEQCVECGCEGTCGEGYCRHEIYGDYSCDKGEQE